MECVWILDRTQFRCKDFFIEPKVGRLLRRTSHSATAKHLGDRRGWVHNERLLAQKYWNQGGSAAWGSGQFKQNGAIVSLRDCSGLAMLFCSRRCFNREPLFCNRQRQVMLRLRTRWSRLLPLEVCVLKDVVGSKSAKLPLDRVQLRRDLIELPRSLRVPYAQSRSLRRGHELVETAKRSGAKFGVPFWCWPERATNRSHQPQLRSVKANRSKAVQGR